MNIILQHWTGDLDKIAELSSRNISDYARLIGAEYQMLRGDVFRRGLTGPCQKMAMLSNEFDAFDGVVMVDADMFSRTDEDIFNVPGVGVHTTYTTSVFVRLAKTSPELVDPRYPYWGGSIWKLTRDQRQLFRARIKEGDLKAFSKNGFEDEGIMHRLSTLAQFADPCRLPDRWSVGNWEEGIEDAAMIHIRSKVRGRPRSETKGRPAEAKLKNYEELVRCRILT